MYINSFVIKLFNILQNIILNIPLLLFQINYQYSNLYEQNILSFKEFDPTIHILFRVNLGNQITFKLDIF